MARQLRIEYPGALYHILSRGNERGAIFRDDKDHTIFLETLRESAEITGVIILAYVLMKNHYHLIVETPNGNLSQFMKHFNLTYTVRFNRRHQRVGHLFQGRYKSLVIEEDPYPPTLSRYIHLNPIRTKSWQEKETEEKIKYLSAYRWSTLPAYLNAKSKMVWLNYSKILSYFGKGNIGHKKYSKYILEGIGKEISNPFEEIKHQIVLGTERFVENIRTRFLTNNKVRELPSLRQLKGLSLDQVISEICEHFGVTKHEIISKNKANMKIKKIAMEMCYRYTNLSQEEIGLRFGNIDYSTVSQNRRRLKLEMEKDRNLRSSFEKINQKLLKLSN